MDTASGITLKMENLLSLSNFIIMFLIVVVGPLQLSPIDVEPSKCCCVATGQASVITCETEAGVNGKPCRKYCVI